MQIFIIYLKWFLNFILCLSVLPACMTVCHMCAWCCWRKASTGTGVTGGSETPWVLGTKLRSSVTSREPSPVRSLRQIFKWWILSQRMFITVENRLFSYQFSTSNHFECFTYFIKKKCSFTAIWVSLSYLGPLLFDKRSNPGSCIWLEKLLLSWAVSPLPSPPT